MVYKNCQYLMLKSFILTINLFFYLLIVLKLYNILDPKFDFTF